MKNARILVVDDERNIRRTLTMILGGAGYETREAGSGEEALARLEESPCELVLLDVRLPGKDGIEVLREITAETPPPAVIMISGHATISTAVEAARAGAFDVLEKPLSKEKVLITVRNALRMSRLDRRVEAIEKVETRRMALVGASRAVEDLRETIRKVAPTPATILITGESGTGKELVARALHEGSRRAEGPFIKVNCAAIPEELIETELFGCVRGAYTGAVDSREGKFMAASGGTLFLDEVGDMSLRVQAKVLRALQEGEIERVGDSRTLPVDVRVLAATNKDLEAEAAAKRFREDLYFRLNVIPLRVPPLRERRGDIPLLCRHFLDLYARENGLAGKEADEGALEILGKLPWKGNVRELKNVIERLAILSEGLRLGAEDLSALLPGPSGGAAGESAPTAGWSFPGPEAIRDAGGLAAARRRFEAACIRACLSRTGGNVSRAARWLGIERTNLHKKMQSLGLTDIKTAGGAPPAEGETP